MRSSWLLFFAVFDCAVFIYGHGGSNQQGTSGLTSLFTCGGVNGTGARLQEAEVVDLSSPLKGFSSPRTCSEVPDMPTGKEGLFAVWDNDDQSVLCCGGYDISAEKRCFKYSGTEWEDLDNILTRGRSGAISAELSDGRFWISGGYASDGPQTSEFFQDGGFSEGPPLPYPFAQHCVVEVEPGFVFLSGNANPGVQEVAVRMDPETGASERMLDMTQPRYGHGCGVVNKGDSFDIIVTGGYNRGQYLTHTEIYNTATRQWREGTPLPEPIGFMSSVKYQGTFLLAGGYNTGNRFFNTIYQYDPATESWILRDETLPTAKRLFGAVLAGPPAANCS